MNETLEETAARIAERGRETLLLRLRPAFKEAASAHADVLSLDDEQLEQMVQRAVDRADGLQWRRALATVATEELGIGLGEALGHPAVARAQELVGAPSYEESLARLSEGAPLREAQAVAGEEGAGAEEVPVPGEPLAHEDSLAEEELLGEEELLEEEELLGEEEPLEEEELLEEEEPLEEGDLAEAGEHPVGDLPEVLRLVAIHLGGIASLQTPERGLELRLGDFGLDIARKPGRVIGRLRWQEINALEVPPPKGLRRRRKQGQTHLLVRTQHGDANFEIPGVPEEELRGQLETLVTRYSAS